jgi:hypothetical protein
MPRCAKCQVSLWPSTPAIVGVLSMIKLGSIRDPECRSLGLLRNVIELVECMGYNDYTDAGAPVHPCVLAFVRTYFNTHACPRCCPTEYAEACALYARVAENCTAYYEHKRWTPARAAWIAAATSSSFKNV